MKLLSTVLVLLVVALAGCAEPAAVVQLVTTADHALASISDSDKEIQKAILTQLDGQLASLDESFLADMGRLAGSGGMVSLDDVKAGKSLYDSKRLTIDQSRRNTQDVFDRRVRTMQAAHQLLQYAQDLVVRNRAAWYDMQQYIQFVTQSKLTSAPAQGANP